MTICVFEEVMTNVERLVFLHFMFGLVGWLRLLCCLLRSCRFFPFLAVTTKKSVIFLFPFPLFSVFPLLFGGAVHGCVWREMTVCERDGEKP